MFSFTCSLLLLEVLSYDYSFLSSLRNASVVSTIYEESNTGFKEGLLSLFRQEQYVFRQLLKLIL
jgi:hypothetical protein